MKNINAVKIGNIVNISINGKLHKKNCGSPAEASELYRLVLTAREDPTDTNLKAIHLYLNERTRIAFMVGLDNLEADSESGEVYLSGFNTPIPNTLVEVIKEYYENHYPLDAILNFWKLLMINPDQRVRTSLFDFITTHDFVLTDKGYMVVYKAVYRKENVGDVEAVSFEEYITNQYLHVKKDWKCSPNKYVVYKDIESDTWQITKRDTAETWNEKERNVEILGNLGALFSAIVNADNKTGEVNNAVYTDMHSKSMSIELGTPVRMDRKECDSDPAIDCSYGLHVGATKYVQSFANSNSVILVCLVNPAHVVAVPQYDHSKMRVSEYFPYAFATYVDGKIDVIEEMYFESDYCEYELKELNEQIAKVKAEQLPIETAIKAEEEVRPMSELMKMLENRMLDLE